MVSEIPACAWKMRLDGGPSKPGKPRGYPIRFTLRMVPKFLKFRSQRKRAGSEGEPPAIEPIRAINDGYNQGVPIGGLGAGSIGRGYRGDFARWHLDIGRHQYIPSLPNQFHIRIDRKGELFVQTLNPRVPKGERLTSWTWGMNPHRATYSALFPRAWTEYDFSDHGAIAVCRQLSPIIAHNYKESSYPVGLFIWSIRNVTNNDITISIMLTWENGISPTRKPMDGDFTKITQLRKDRIGIELGQERTCDCDPVSFGLSVDGGESSSITYREAFNTEASGIEIWDDFAKFGYLKAPSEDTVQPRKIGAALCSTAEIPPNESIEIPFAIAWDIPLMRFGSGRVWYRRYTQFFGTDGNNAVKIADTALNSWAEWERMIIDWQRPIIESDKPDWLKCALLNELYYLVDGGTAWETGEIDKGLSKEGIGHFAYLECFDYPFYNTYDVHFYSSFALAKLFPELEKSIQKDFADSVLSEDSRLMTIIFTGLRVPRKPLGVVPHDLGSPHEDPWILPNAYNFQDIGRWKDLNSKFVLQVYRDYILSRDEEFLRYCWPAALKAMEYLLIFDTDNDGLPENEGFPDQTYDAWEMKGPSAYCGSLFLAATKALVAMAKKFGEENIVTKYSAIFEKGKRAFEEKLWNGEYYDLDASGKEHSKVIMADQLAGQWYARVCGFDPIVPSKQARKVMKMVFQHNVMGHSSGKRGVMNGMRRDGSIDTSSFQSAEVWTGTSYAVSALMIYEDLIEEGLQTAKGVFQTTYRDRGYWFRTPEAWTVDGRFRASMYMRPLAIWAIEFALRSRD